ncbi:hypothetical protein XA41_25800, partial [Escherichia coli]
FTMVIYGLSLVGFGLLISSLCSTQQQAFIGVFVFLMPAILLFRLRFSGGKHASMAAKPDVD